MTVTLYRIPQLRADKPNTISYENPSDRTRFFNAITTKLQVSEGDSNIGRITDIGKLYQEVTVFTNGRDPYTSYNYASIHKAGKYYYYYITNYREIGNSQVIYSLKKDTLITYVTLLNAPDVAISQHRALVTREHKPRFNYENNTALYHRIPEPGDTTKPILHSTASISGARRVRYVYKNRTDSKPVAYPYVESPLSITVQGTDWIGTVYSSIETGGETLYMWDGNFHYTYGTGTPNIPVTVPSNMFVLYIRTALGGRSLILRNKTTGNYDSLLFTVPAGVDLTIKVSTTNVQRLIVAPSYISNGTPWSTITTTYDTINFSPTRTAALPLWSDINNYDAMTDRIIELPYFDPAGMTFYEDGYGIFLPLETKMVYTLYSTIYNPFNYDMSKTNKNHVVGNDPKLYTSQFAPIVITLNGNAIGIKREMLSDPGGIPQNIDVSLYLQNEVLFPSTFNTSVYFNDHAYDVEDEYELEQTFDVNNEIATIKDEAYTYNQYYKDIDDKTRKIQESSAIRNNALNVVNQALGITGGMIAGGTPNPVQLATRSGQATINIAQSFMDLQDQLRMNNLQAKQKYIGLLLSTTKINGAPLGHLRPLGRDGWGIQTYALKDLDLLYWDQVFHKFGYTTLEYKSPVLKTRSRWDYKQMIIDEVSSPIVNDECLLDIRERFAEGVTIFHPYNIAGLVDQISWAQSAENWEI